MIVKDIMNKAVATSAPERDLVSVIDIMRERDCGFLPVVDSHGVVVGVITDRDVCLAGGTKHRALARRLLIQGSLSDDRRCQTWPRRPGFNGFAIDQCRDGDSACKLPVHQAGPPGTIRRPPPSEILFAPGRCGTKPNGPRRRVTRHPAATVGHSS